MKLNQKGFSAVEALLILIILALLGGVGWYVWSAQNSQSATVADSTSATDSANLETYKNDELGLQFKYPRDWGDAQIGDGPLVGPQEGGYKQVTFTEEKRVSIDFVTKGYFSPLDGCNDDVVFLAKHGQYARQAGVIGWDGDNIKSYGGVDDDGNPVVGNVSKAKGGGSPGWNEVKKDGIVLAYTQIEDADSKYTAVSAADSVCGGAVTQAQADEANAYFKFHHYAVNYKGGSVLGTNGQFDGREGDDEEVRDQLFEVLETIESL